MELCRAVWCVLCGVQVLHKAQLDDRKLLTSQCGQVDDMYESLAAHEQKVPTTDQVKHDDLTEALATFQAQLTEVITSTLLGCTEHAAPRCQQYLHLCA